MTDSNLRETPDERVSRLIRGGIGSHERNDLRACIKSLRGRRDVVEATVRTLKSTGIGTKKPLLVTLEHRLP